ncbi:carboxylesterase family protein [Colletotrichum kahawae]|uniref:Carboxylesterase family protein n=1 Tax=Colletotrichum kahawae TaxID=34407 RepID=A0AAE0D3D7_COLKA|nr:carboxylesterase family protein [Colletotrichum kahawae]
MHPITVLILGSTLWSQVASSSPNFLIVDLGYQLHQVSSCNQTGGFHNFSNIRYAALPFDNLCFSAPEPPATNRPVVETGASVRLCPQGSPAWLSGATAFVTNFTQGLAFNSSAFREQQQQFANNMTPARQPDWRLNEDRLVLDFVVPKRRSKEGYRHGRIRRRQLSDASHHVLPHVSERLNACRSPEAAIVSAHSRQQSISRAIDVQETPIFDGTQPHVDNLGRSTLLMAETRIVCNTLFLRRAFANVSFTYIFGVLSSLHGDKLKYNSYNGAYGAQMDSRSLNVTVADVLQDYAESYAISGKPVTDVSGIDVFPKVGSKFLAWILDVAGMQSAVDSAVNNGCSWWQTDWEASPDTT